MRHGSALFILFFFFFNDTATTEIYTLSLHDALPIFDLLADDVRLDRQLTPAAIHQHAQRDALGAAEVGELIERGRSEEHTSELQSQSNLVCRLLLEKKKKKRNRYSESTSHCINGIAI